jgi:hypothetical protein
MTVQEMATRFQAYDKEVLAFTFGEWLDMNWDERDARQAEIGCCLKSALMGNKGN